MPKRKYLISKDDFERIKNRETFRVKFTALPIGKMEGSMKSIKDRIDDLRFDYYREKNQDAGFVRVGRNEWLEMKCFVESGAHLQFADPYRFVSDKWDGLAVIHVDEDSVLSVC